MRHFLVRKDFSQIPGRGVVDDPALEADGAAHGGLGQNTPLPVLLGRSKRPGTLGHASLLTGQRCLLGTQTDSQRWRLLSGPRVQRVRAAYPGALRVQAPFAEPP